MREFFDFGGYQREPEGFMSQLTLIFVTLLMFSMFLASGDGTPYDIFYSLLNGNPVLYPIIVVLLFLVYVSLFYYIYYLIKRKIKKAQIKKSALPCGKRLIFYLPSM